MSQASATWRVRPAEATHPGRAVTWERLVVAIEGEEIGELDEVLGPGEKQWLPVAEHPQASQHVPRPARVFTEEVEQAESDMTPMIDVTFQLLIFFMIAATYTVQKALDLPATKSDSEGAAAVTMEQLMAESIVAKIAADGRITIQDKLVPVEGVEQAIRDSARSMKSAELVLDVDDQAIHDVVVKVIDAAGGAQIEKVLFVSRQPAAAGK